MIMCTVTVETNKSLVGRTCMKPDVYVMCIYSESSNSWPCWTICAAWTTARDGLKEECYCLSFKVDLAFVGIQLGVLVTTTVVELASE